jgi:cell division protein FtsZ
VNEALTLVHDSADGEAEIIFGSLIDETVKDEIKITIIATGFVSRETKVRANVVAPVQIPMVPRVAVTAPPREELAVYAPQKPQVRALSNPEVKAVSAPRVVMPRDASLPLDDDQFDIPTFLRRQGQTDL